MIETTRPTDRVLTAEAAMRLHHDAMAAGLLMGWTVTENPKDYPGKFVARAMIIDKVGVYTREVMIADALETLELGLAQWCVKFDRDPEDDPVVVGFWL